MYTCCRVVKTDYEKVSCYKPSQVRHTQVSSYLYTGDTAILILTDKTPKPHHNGNTDTSTLLQSSSSERHTSNYCFHQLSQGAQLERHFYREYLHRDIFTERSPGILFTEPIFTEVCNDYLLYVACRPVY